jgi:hypothetical protein
MSRPWFTSGLGFFSLIFILLTLGCGADKSKLRILHASPDEGTLDVLIDGKTVSSNLAYEASTGYLSVGTGSRHVQLQASGSTTNVIDQNLTINSGGSTTLIAANFAASITPLVLTDDATAPASGEFKLRVVNAAPALGPVDVYVVPPGTDLTTVSPAFSNLAFADNSDYLTFPAGNYVVEFTPPGSIFVLLAAGPTNFQGDQNRTLVALDDPGGGFTSVTLNDRN